MSKRHLRRHGFLHTLFRGNDGRASILEATLAPTALCAALERPDCFSRLQPARRCGGPSGVPVPGFRAEHAFGRGRSAASSRSDKRAGRIALRRWPGQSRVSIGPGPVAGQAARHSLRDRSRRTPPQASGLRGVMRSGFCEHHPVSPVDARDIRHHFRQAPMSPCPLMLAERARHCRFCVQRADCFAQVKKPFSVVCIVALRSRSYLIAVGCRGRMSVRGLAPRNPRGHCGLPPENPALLHHS
jgi:hypothetical protein